MRTSKAFVILAFGACVASLGCAQKLRPASHGPVDPAGGKPGNQKVSFVKPPYRALDTVNVTGQSPLRKSSPSRLSSQSGSK